MVTTHITRRKASSLVLAALATQGAGAFAQKNTSVALSGVMGSKALLVVNGTPKTVAVGDVHGGVKLVSVSAQDAVVDVEGKRVQLNLGGTHVNLGGNSSEGSGSRIVLTAGTGGHFVTRGSINGKSVQFLVDTGATSVAMSQAEAERIGLKYKSGQMGVSSTANGEVMMYITKLDSVRINDVQVFNVDAAVLLAPMDMVLLGNSFLTRFQMKRENNVLTLDKKS